MNNVVVFTVIYPDALKYVNDFLCCLQSQTFKNFDLLIVNDGCNTSELEMIFCNINNEIINTTDTPAKNRELGIKFAHNKGYEYLIFCDIDDWFKDTRFDRVIEKLINYDIVVNNLNIVGENHEILCRDYFSHSITKNSIIDIQFLKDKNILGLSNSAIRLQEKVLVEIPREITIADWYYFTCCLENGLNVFYIEESLTDYRQHSNNLIGIDDFSPSLFKKLVLLKIKHYEYLCELFPKYKKQLSEVSELTMLSDSEISKLIEKNKLINNHPLWWENVKK